MSRVNSGCDGFRSGMECIERVERCFTGNPIEFDTTKLERFSNLRGYFMPIQENNGYDYPWIARNNLNVFNPDWYLTDRYIGKENSASGNIVSFSDGAKGSPLKSLSLDIVPYQSGQYEPSPSNIRPITGYSEANIIATGKNLAPSEDSAKSVTDISASHVYDVYTGTWTVTATASGFAQTIVTFDMSPFAGQRVTFSLSEVTKSRDSLYPAWILDTDDGTVWLPFPIDGSSRTITLPSDVREISLRLLVSQVLADVGDSVTFVGIQIEAGTVATEFEPPAGERYTIEWEDAGTVYGGTLNVVSGTLTVKNIYLSPREVDHIFDDSGSGTWYCTVSLTYPALSDSSFAISDMFKRGNISDGEGIFYITNRDNDALVMILPQNITTKASANEWMQINEPNFVYEIATPVEYQLTPTEIRTLLGTNNIWADTGDIDLTYVADAHDGDTLWEGEGYKTFYIPCAPETLYTAARERQIADERFAIAEDIIPTTQGLPAKGDAVINTDNATNTGTPGTLMTVSLTTEQRISPYKPFLLIQAYGEEVPIDDLIVERGTYEPSPIENIGTLSGRTSLTVNNGANAYITNWASRGAQYAGWADMVEGVLHVTHKLLVLDGNTVQFTGYSIYGDEFWVEVPDMYRYGEPYDPSETAWVAIGNAPGVLSNKFRYYYDYANDHIGAFWAMVQLNKPYPFLRFRFQTETGIDTLEDANAWLRAQEEKVVCTYQLAEPFDLSISKQRLYTLAGHNELTSEDRMWVCVIFEEEP